MNEQSPMAKYKLLSAALASLELACDGAVAFMTVTQKMVDDNKAAWEDTDGMVNFARSIRGVDCGVFLSPAKHGGIRVSMRSKGHMVDAGRVCLTLGGGGHRGAAGCTLTGELAAARVTVEKALGAAIDEAKAAVTTPTSND